MKRQGLGTRDKGSEKRFAGPLTIVAMAAVALVPMMVRGVSCGHDYDFHAISWMDCLESWKHGILYPHWSETPNFGAGEPRFVFYPPLTRMLSALLGSVLPVGAVLPVLMFLLLCGIGLATRALTREALEDGAATLAGCIAIGSGYALFTAYERAAYAELAGGIWIPLLLLFVLREARREAPHGWVDWIAGGSAVPIALLLAGAWLTNAPVGVIASYLLAAVALAVAVLTRSWTPLVRAGVGVAVGLGLASFYLVPAAYEQRWVDIRQATDDPGLLIQNSWLFARHHVPLLEEHDVELTKVSVIAVAMIALALLAAGICRWRRRMPGRRDWWMPLVMIPAVVMVLQLPVSWPIWHWLPKLNFLQFPWRWLVAVEAPMAILVAAAITGKPGRGRLVVYTAAGVVLVAAAFGAGIIFHQECEPGESGMALRSLQQNGNGVMGTDEYAPPGADDTMVAAGLPEACLVSDPALQLGAGEQDTTPVWTAEQKTCAATAQWESGAGLNSEHKVLRMEALRAGYLVLKLRRYPAWRVTVNGTAAKVLEVREDGLMAVAVPQGSAQVRADWMATRDVIAGCCISGISVLLVTGLGLIGLRKRIAAQLK